MTNPELSERAWQAWLSKNRKSDEAFAAKRLKILQFGLAAVVVVVVVQNLF